MKPKMSRTREPRIAATREGVLLTLVAVGLAATLIPLAVASVRDGVAVAGTETLKQEFSAAGIPTSDEGMSELYKDLTKREATEEYLRIVEAINQFRRTVGLFEVYVDSEQYRVVPGPPGTTWPLADVMRHYGQQSDPLVRRIDDLADADLPIWTPIQFRGSNTLLPDLQNARSVFPLLDIRFVDHFHRGETDEAIADLRRIRWWAEASRFPIGWIGISIWSNGRKVACSLIAQTLEHGVWSADQLALLQAMVVEPLPLETYWRDAQRGSIGELASEVFADHSLDDPATSFGPGLLSLSPSGRNQWLKSILDEYREGPPSLDPARYTVLLSDYYPKVALRPVGPNRDTLAVIPVPVTPTALPLVNYGTDPYRERWRRTGVQRQLDSLIALRCQRRMVAAAVACARYAKETGDWPTSLDDLELPSEMLRGLNGQPFGFRVIDATSAEVFSRLLGNETASATFDEEQSNQLLVLRPIRIGK